jgi:formyl-CoA transferase
VWFSIHGRNKLCVSLDLKSAEGRERVKRLVPAPMRSSRISAGYSSASTRPEVLQAVETRVHDRARLRLCQGRGPTATQSPLSRDREAMGGLRGPRTADDPRA